jgi:hypothetical protein
MGDLQTLECHSSIEPRVMGTVDDAKAALGDDVFYVKDAGNVGAQQLEYILGHAYPPLVFAALPIPAGSVFKSRRTREKRDP